MERRSFLGCGALAGAAAIVPGGSRDAEAGPGPNEVFDVPAFELDETTVASLQKRDGRGRAHVAEDRRGVPRPDRRARPAGPAARERHRDEPGGARDRRRARRRAEAKGPRAALHGIPVLLKDNVDTSDRMTNTAGSLALEGSHPPQDAPLARRLRDAGAILLGKANLSEWANFRSSRSVSGWSGRGGQCRNPYALDRNPCGSSSGSGVAVSANLTARAVGTETDGSIVCPATTCGVVGIKPTVGLVSRAGVIPISETQDTAGPMARSVADAAALLSALAGSDPRDPATAEAAKHATDYTRFLDADGLRGARIGVGRNLAGFHPDTDRVFEEAVAELKRRGAEVIDPADVPNVKELGDPELEVLLYEFKAGLEAYLAALGADGADPHPRRPSRSTIGTRTARCPTSARSFLKAQEKGPLTTPAYREALDKCRASRALEGLDAVFDKNRLDALVAPTGAPAWVIDPVSGGPLRRRQLDPAAVSGHPSISAADGRLRVRAAGRPVVHRRARSEPVLCPARARLRAGDAPPAPAPLPRHRRARPRLTAPVSRTAGARPRYPSQG